MGFLSDLAHGFTHAVQQVVSHPLKAAAIGGAGILGGEALIAAFPASAGAVTVSGGGAAELASVGETGYGLTAPVAVAATTGGSFVSTLTTAGQIAGATSALARVFLPAPQLEALPPGAPYQLGITYYAPPAELRPTTVDSGGLPSPGAAMTPGSAQVAIGLLVALVLLAAHRRKHA